MTRFPKITVRSISGNRCLCEFEPSRFIGEGWLGCLLLEGGVIWGRFVDVDAEERTVVFVLKAVDDGATPEPGVSYPYLDSYWGGQAEIVIDRERSWTARRFAPVDGVEYHREGSRMITKVGPDAPPGGRLVPAAWDHEHCELCWATISVAENTDAWQSSEDEWVCATCYETRVRPRSLDFIDVDQNGAAGPAAPVPSDE